MIKRRMREKTNKTRGERVRGRGGKKRKEGKGDAS